MRNGNGDEERPRQARRHDGGLQSASRPQKIICDDELLYAVKFAQNEYGDGRAIFTEQVVGRLGRRIGAPVPVVALVEVPAELVDEIRTKPDLNLGFEPHPGLHHGSVWALGYSDRQAIAYVDANRQRFGALDVLYTWFWGADQQWIYRNEAPHEVLSVDHSGFLPGAPGWTVEGLAANVGNVVPDPVLATIGLTLDDRRSPLEQLATITDEEIAQAVAITPDEWGTTPAERDAVASYLSARRDRVLEILGA